MTYVWYGNKDEWKDINEEYATYPINNPENYLLDSSRKTILAIVNDTTDIYGSDGKLNSPAVDKVIYAPFNSSNEITGDMKFTSREGIKAGFIKLYYDFKKPNSNQCGNQPDWSKNIKRPFRLAGWYENDQSLRFGSNPYIITKTNTSDNKQYYNITPASDAASSCWANDEESLAERLKIQYGYVRKLFDSIFGGEKLIYTGFPIYVDWGNVPRLRNETLTFLINDEFKGVKIGNKTYDDVTIKHLQMNQNENTRYDITVYPKNSFWKDLGSSDKDYSYTVDESIQDKDAKYILDRLDSVTSPFYEKFNIQDKEALKKLLYPERYEIKPTVIEKLYSLPTYNKIIHNYSSFNNVDNFNQIRKMFKFDFYTNQYPDYYSQIKSFIEDVYKYETINRQTTKTLKTNLSSPFLSLFKNFIENTEPSNDWQNISNDVYTSIVNISSIYEEQVRNYKTFLLLKFNEVCHYLILGKYTTAKEKLKEMFSFGNKVYLESINTLFLPTIYDALQMSRMKESFDSDTKVVLDLFPYFRQKNADNNLPIKYLYLKYKLDGDYYFENGSKFKSQRTKNEITFNIDKNATVPHASDCKCKYCQFNEIIEYLKSTDLNIEETVYSNFIKNINMVIIPCYSCQSADGSYVKTYTLPNDMKKYKVTYPADGVCLPISPILIFSDKITTNNTVPALCETMTFGIPDYLSLGYQLKIIKDNPDYDSVFTNYDERKSLRDISMFQILTTQYKFDTWEYANDWVLLLELINNYLNINAKEYSLKIPYFKTVKYYDYPINNSILNDWGLKIAIDTFNLKIKQLNTAIPNKTNFNYFIFKNYTTIEQLLLQLQSFCYYYNEWKGKISNSDIDALIKLIWEIDLQDYNNQTYNFKDYKSVDSEKSVFEGKSYYITKQLTDTQRSNIKQLMKKMENIINYPTNEYVQEVDWNVLKNKLLAISTFNNTTTNYKKYLFMNKDVIDLLTDYMDIYNILKDTDLGDYTICSFYNNISDIAAEINIQIEKKTCKGYSYFDFTGWYSGTYKIDQKLMKQKYNPETEATSTLKNEFKNIYDNNISFFKCKPETDVFNQVLTSLKSFDPITLQDVVDELRILHDNYSFYNPDGNFICDDDSKPVCRVDPTAIRDPIFNILSELENIYAADLIAEVDRTAELGNTSEAVKTLLRGKVTGASNSVLYCGRAGLGMKFYREAEPYKGNIKEDIYLSCGKELVFGNIVSDSYLLTKFNIPIINDTTATENIVGRNIEGIYGDEYSNLNIEAKDVLYSDTVIATRAASSSSANIETSKWIVPLTVDVTLKSTTNNPISYAFYSNSIQTMEDQTVYACNCRTGADGPCDSTKLKISNIAMCKCLYYWKSINWKPIKEDLNKLLKNKYTSSKGNVRLIADDINLTLPTSSYLLSNNETFTAKDIEIHYAKQQNVKFGYSYVHAEKIGNDNDSGYYDSECKSTKAKKAVNFTIGRDDVKDENCELYRPYDISEFHCDISDMFKNAQYVDSNQETIQLNGNLDLHIAYTNDTASVANPFELKRNLFFITNACVKYWLDAVNDSLNYMLFEITSILNRDSTNYILARLFEKWIDYSIDKDVTLYNIPIGACGIENENNMMARYNFYGTQYTAGKINNEIYFKMSNYENYLDKVFHDLLSDTFVINNNLDPAFIIHIPKNAAQIIDIATGIENVDRLQAYTTSFKEAEMIFLNEQTLLITKNKTLTGYNPISSISVPKLTIKRVNNKVTFEMESCQTFYIFSKLNNVKVENNTIKIEYNQVSTDEYHFLEIK